ncbi:SHO1 [Candida oxycetoniae]|uniref:High osmolarity signaling protein SHO1 n=1 Tax=Candida oxycetoniae TaxID=497107 RepID=A0AAI9WW96_9ASCO|nr:SHO1 [Candida oxycetoniae]KAI3402931.2 SHO1 [Candida oxycetoniae]
MGFKITNFTGDPFAISTVSFGIISWIVSLAGAATSQQSQFPHFTWWGIAYQIVIILIIFILYANNNIELYKFTLVGLVSIGFIYTTNSTNNLIYNSNSSGNLCCAAGCILSSILNLIWILYFGGHPESPTNQFIDSFSYKNHSHEQLGNQILSSGKNELFDETQEYRKYGSSSGNLAQQDSLKQPHVLLSGMNNRSSQVQSTPSNQNYISSTQLNGLENFSSQDVPISASATRDLTRNNSTVNNNNNNNKRNTMYTDSEAGTGIIFRYKAKALYSYDANPDDINEISFIKDEILEVDDIDGKWWQARRANGQVGICPSNYVKLIDT